MRFYHRAHQVARVRTVESTKPSGEFRALLQQRGHAAITKFYQDGANRPSRNGWNRRYGRLPLFRQIRSD
jgi:hypothetical protein